MTHNNEANQLNSYTLREWAEAYVDLQEDELLQLYVVYLSCSEAGPNLLELSRQIWRAHGLRSAPFDFILREIEIGLRRKIYGGSRAYYQALSGH